MQPKENIESQTNQEKLEVVIGIFGNHQDASRVATSLRGPETKLQKISRRDPASPDQLPEIVYEDIEEIGSDDIASGALLGGAIGAGSGLLLMALPAATVGLAIAAPFAAGLAGAWIGAVAGVDEANRGIELPNQDDYQRMLADGKSFVVIAGDEAKRSQCGIEMKELGAEDVYQHPPIAQVVR